MKIKNILSLSAVTLMSLGLAMGATGLSASAAGTGNPTGGDTSSNNPTQNSDVGGEGHVGPFKLTSASLNQNTIWNVKDNSLDLGPAQLSFDNETHSSQNYTVTPTINDFELKKDGKTPETKISANIQPATQFNYTSKSIEDYSQTTGHVNISMNSNQNYDLTPNESGVTYSTNLTWTVSGVAPSNK